LRAGWRLRRVPTSTARGPGRRAHERLCTTRSTDVAAVTAGPTPAPTSSLCPDPGRCTGPPPAHRGHDDAHHPSVVHSDTARDGADHRGAGDEGRSEPDRTAQPHGD